MSIELAGEIFGAPVSRWKRYPAYRDSGVEWLGEVPVGWEVTKLKYCINELVAGGTPDSGNDNYWSTDKEDTAWVTIADMTKTPFIESTQKRVTKDGLVEKRLRILPTGTLLYSIFASLGKVAILGIPATTNQAILGVLISKETMSRDFLKRWFEYMEPQISQLSSSNTQDNLNATKIKNMIVFQPTSPEQRTIAAFLDRETGRIDTLIEKKGRQVELLREKRAALISHAVTKGLDPDVKMKDSGVEWLGEVPVGWEVTRLKYISTVNDETLSETTDLDYELVYVDISSVDPVSGIKYKEPMTFENAPSRARRKVRHGDVIISTVRTYLRAISPINFPEPNMIVSTGFAVVHPKEGMESQFAAHVFHAPYFVERVVANSVGVSYPAINASELITFKVALPPLTEQCTIAAFLDRETGRIDILTTKIRKSILKLREYRTALISAAVTGKIDVREGV